MIQVYEKLDAQVEQQVCRYLEAAPASAGACIEHDPHWLHVLQRGLGHRPLVLLARAGADGEIEGYLPLALVASRLFGRFLVSLPYLNRGGVVAHDQTVSAALISKAVELAESHDVQYLELRHGNPLAHEALTASRSEKLRMVLELPESEEALWKHYNAKVRNQIRKGDKSELTVRWGGQELVDDFYSVFAVNMRDLGTPVYSRRLFEQILEQFPGRAELALVACGGEPAAGALLIHDHAPRSAPSTERRGCTQVPSASCLRRYNQSNANMWMYHHLLLRAVQRGSREFDFGRSSEDSGTYRFKKQWGAEPCPTVWQYHVREGDINSMRPESAKNRRRIAVWQKLPVWLTRLVGPTIVRGIP